MLPPRDVGDSYLLEDSISAIYILHMCTCGQIFQRLLPPITFQVCKLISRSHYPQNLRGSHVLSAADLRIGLSW